TLDDRSLATAEIKLLKKPDQGGRIWQLAQLRGYADRDPGETVKEIWKEFERQVFEGKIKLLDSYCLPTEGSGCNNDFGSEVSPLEGFIGISLDNTLDDLTNAYRKLGTRDDMNVVHSFIPTEGDLHYPDFIEAVDSIAQDIVRLVRLNKGYRVSGGSPS
ncbi:MAG: hypothetical protein NZT61_05325, partial [Deltaproteobacteria bacterium]|nr:hypothetical protein [Deltaproteobacteria bacterium]